MDPARLDRLPFGVVGLTPEGIVDVYNQTEARLAGLNRDDVLGTSFFLSVAQCMNNFLVAQRFEDEDEDRRGRHLRPDLQDASDAGEASPAQAGRPPATLPPDPAHEPMTSKTSTSRASTSRASRNASCKALREENGALLQFPLRLPGRSRLLDADGTMSMLNPLAMQLVLPLVRDHEVTNLFRILDPYAPELRNMLRPSRRSRVPCAMPIACSSGRGGGKDRDKVLSCTLVKLSHDRYVATLSDVSVQSRRSDASSRRKPGSPR